MLWEVRLAWLSVCHLSNPLFIIWYSNRTPTTSIFSNLFNLLSNLSTFKDLLGLHKHRSVPGNIIFSPTKGEATSLVITYLLELYSFKQFKARSAWSVQLDFSLPHTDPRNLIWVLCWEPAPTREQGHKTKSPSFTGMNVMKLLFFWTYSYICYSHSPLNSVGVAKQYSNHFKIFWKQWIPVNSPLGYTIDLLLNGIHAFFSDFPFFVVLGVVVLVLLLLLVLLQEFNL